MRTAIDIIMVLLAVWFLIGVLVISEHLARIAWELKRLADINMNYMLNEDVKDHLDKSKRDERLKDTE